MNRPNFFIVGAVRSGTTALYTYLDEHLQIFMGRPKDSNYFSDDFAGLRTVSTPKEYAALFKRAHPKHLAVGEASALYLHSEVACAEIRKFRPDAKIIVMLRNPMRLVESLHAHLCYTMDENESDFETAWRLQDERREGNRIPPHCRAPKQLQYREMGMLGAHMQRLFDVFPRDQAHVALFDDLQKTPRRVYEDVLEFLEVPSDNRVDFPIINPRRQHKHRGLGHFTEQPPRALQQAVRWAKRVIPVEEFGLFERVRRRNVSPHKRPPLAPAFRDELRETFEDDINRLAQLIGRDLSHWR